MSKTYQFIQTMFDPKDEPCVLNLKQTVFDYFKVNYSNLF